MKISKKVRSILYPASTVKKNRYKRIKKWKSKIRKRHTNQRKFKEKQQKRIIENKKRVNLLEEAKRKEYRMAKNMDQQWLQYQKEKRYFIDKIQHYLKNSSKIRPILPFVNKLFKIYEMGRDIEYGTYLTIKKQEMIYLFSHYIYQYLTNFKIKEKEYDNFLNNLIFVGKEFSKYEVLSENKNLHSFWSKYNSNLMPNQAETLMRKLIPLNYLNMLIFYSHLGLYSKEKGGPLEALGYRKNEITSSLVQKFIKQRIKHDIQFIGINVEKSDLKTIRKYFQFKKNISRQLEKIVFSNFTTKEKNKSKNLICEIADSLSCPYYGNLDQDILKTEIYHWLVSLMGDSYSKYKSLLLTLNKIYPTVKNFYTTPSLKQLLKGPSQYKLKYLSRIGASRLLTQEYLRQKENLFRGNLIFWSNFTWNNELNSREIKKILSFINYIKKLSSFKKIFGDYPFYSSPKFYMSTLTYWGEWALEKHKKLKSEYKNPTAEIHHILKRKFNLMHYIYSLPEYKKLYGNIDLSYVHIANRDKKEKIQRFVSTLSFFADWIRLNNFDKKFAKDFFQNLHILITSPLKNKLKKFYRLIGINIDLSIKNKKYEVKEQIIGIYSSWVTYFMFRGYKDKLDFQKGLNEILYIAKIANNNNLNFNQDEIKYWLHRKYKKGYTNENLKAIFKNLKESSKLLSLASKLAIRKIQKKEITFSQKSFKNNLLIKIKNIGKTFMFPGEKQRLAEQVLVSQEITVKELAQDYSYGIIVDALYALFYQERLTPQQIHNYSSMFKNQGFSAKEIITFLKLKHIINSQENKLVKKLVTKSISYPRLSENEVNGFLLNSLSPNKKPPKKSEIIQLFNLIYALQDTFYKEHKYYLDSQKVLNLLTSRNSYYKPWQIKLLVDKGQLSRESNNFMIKNLGTTLNLKRFLLNNLSQKFTPIESNKNINSFIDLFYSSNWYSNRREIKKSIHQTNTLLNNLLSETVVHKKSFDINNLYFNLKKNVYNISPFLYRFNKRHQTKKNLKRRNEILQKQKTLPVNIDKPVDLKVSQKPLLERKKKLTKYKKKLIKQAKASHNITLTPNQISALLWKIREGYSVEEALKIYVYDKKKLKQYYKKIFNKSSLTVKDSNIITYLAEQINFYPISINQVKKILQILKKIEDNIISLLDEKIPKDKILTAATKAYYAGVNKKQIKDISVLAKKLLHKLKEDSIIHHPSQKFKKNIVNNISKLYKIKLFSSTGEKRYSKNTYLKVISNTLEKLKLPNYLTTNKAKNHIYHKLIETNQKPFNFKYLIFKTKNLNSYLSTNGVNVKPVKLLIYADYTLQSISNRLNILKLIPQKKIKNRSYYLNRLSRDIKTSISKIKKENIIKRLKKGSSLSSSTKQKNSKLNYKTILKKFFIGVSSTFGYSVILTFSIIFILLILL